MKIFLFLASLSLSIFISLNVYRNTYQPYHLILWFVSIAYIILAALYRTTLDWKKIISKEIVLLTIVCFLPLIVRILLYNLTRIHTDDLITAYFSATTDFSKINFFSGIPQDKAQWVTQFPTLFFFLQKVFFVLFGETLLSIKLSILPYVGIISFTLYLVVREILNKKTAIVAVFLYGFLAISLYYETLGLHFVSSTASFLVFFYFSIRLIKKNTSSSAIFMGITCALCYLFYITSYIAFPFLVIVFILQLIRVRSLFVVRNFVIALLAFCILIAPYTTYAFTKDNYFTSRINQVSLLNGTWSAESEEIRQGVSPFKVLQENLTNSIRSLYKDGYGGHGGYIFHNLAFIEKMALYLFTIGSVIAFILMIKRVEFLFLFGVLIASFATMVFSIPPPAYQRLLISIPFIAIIASLPLYVLTSLNKTPVRIRLFTGSFILLTYIISNVQHFHTSVIKETNNINLRVASHINNYYPNRNVYVASFPGYIFEKIYYFVPGKRAKSIVTGYHDDLLKSFNPKEKYVYVILYPDVFDEKFAALDTTGRFVDFYHENDKMYSLFTN